MSWSNSSNLSHALLESNIRQQGNKVKLNLRAVAKLVGRLQKSHSPQDLASLRDECNEAQEQIKQLEEMEADSRAEQHEKAMLLKAYGNEFGKLMNSFQSIAQRSRANSGAQQQMLKVQSFEEDMLRERNKEIQEIESCLIEVSDMIKYCSETVLQQGQMLDRIENFTDVSSLATEKTVSELEKASSYQSSGRRCWIYLLVIVAVFVGLLLMYLSFAK